MRRLHPENIKAEIRKKYGSLVNFEVAKGLPRDTTRDVLRGRSVRKTAEAMARELGVPVSVILRPKKQPKPRKRASTKRDSFQQERAN